jgi:hypothetical protein
MHVPKMIRLCVTALVFALGVASRPAVAAFSTLVTMDVTQPFTDAENNLELVLKGDQRTNLPGQYINPFAAPNSVNVQFDPTANTTTIIYAGQPIQNDAPALHTLGFAINTLSISSGIVSISPDTIDGYWTMNQIIEGHIPQPNISSAYQPSTQTATVTISNDPDTFSLFHVGYLVTSTSFAFSSLNRTTLPPSSFLPSGIPDGTTLNPGDSVSFSLTGVPQNQFVTVFVDAQYSGSSSGNPYKDFSGHWFEIQAVPEPGSMALLLTGVVTLAGRLRWPRRARVDLDSPERGGSE